MRAYPLVAAFASAALGLAAQAAPARAQVSPGARVAEDVQAWTLSHSMVEYSGQLETVESCKPVKDAVGMVVALDHETVFYDPTAFVQPLRATYRYGRRAALDDPERRYTYIECLSNIRNVDGRPRQITKADARFVDYYRRPWAQNWEEHFKKGWDKPEDTSGVAADVLDIFK